MNIEDLKTNELRPQSFDDYIGQDSLKKILKITIDAAKKEDRVLDHILLYGPPGLGKTTIAAIIAKELNKNIKYLNGSSFTRMKDLISVVSDIKRGDIVFIDEIHRVPKQLEEAMYTLMEDYYIDLVIDKSAISRTCHYNVEPFTLIGATTRFGDLEYPFRERFGIIKELDYYSIDSLCSIIKNIATKNHIDITDDAIKLIAERSRRTPRTAIRIFKRVKDYSISNNLNIINYDITLETLNLFEINEDGLDKQDLKYIDVLLNIFHGGPVGIKALSTSLNTVEATIEDVIEPYLITNGFITLTKSGRMATPKLTLKYKKEG